MLTAAGCNGRWLLIVGALCGAAWVRPDPLEAQALLTQEEALRQAFPEATRVERRTAFLDEAALAAVRNRAGDDIQVEGRVVTYYVGVRAGNPVGVAYFDAHRVRTLPEVLMIVVGLDDRIVRIETLKFSEPPEYRAPDGWLEQFEGAALTDALSLKGSIINITGATLTSQAVTRASRRVLALHEVVRPFERYREETPE